MDDNRARFRVMKAVLYLATHTAGSPLKQEGCGSARANRKNRKTK